MGYLHQLAWADVFQYLELFELTTLPLLSRDARQALHDVFTSRTIRLLESQLSILNRAPWWKAWQGRSAGMVVSMSLEDWAEKRTTQARETNYIGTFFYEMCQLGMPKLQYLVLSEARFMSRRWDAHLPSLVYLTVHNWRGTPWNLDAPKLCTYGVTRNNLHDIDTKIAAKYEDNFTEEHMSPPDAIVFDSYWPRGYMGVHYCHNRREYTVSLTQENRLREAEVIGSELPYPHGDRDRWGGTRWPQNSKADGELTEYLQWWWSHLRKKMPQRILNIISHQQFLIEVHHRPFQPLTAWLDLANNREFATLPIWVDVVPLPGLKSAPKLSEDSYYCWEPKNKNRVFHPLTTTFERPAKTPSEMAQLQALKRIEICLPDGGLFFDPQDFFPTGAPWSGKTTEVVLKSVFPRNLHNCRRARPIVDQMQVGYFALGRCPESALRIFWGYLLLHSVWKQTGRAVRVSCSVIQYFPHPWDDVLLQMVRGHYADDTVSLLFSQAKLEGDLRDKYLAAASYEEREQLWKEMDGRLQYLHQDGIGVGLLNAFRKKQFENWYDSLATATDPRAIPAEPLADYWQRIGGVFSYSPWYLRQMARGDWRTMRKWDVHPRLPISLGPFKHYLDDDS